MTAWDKVKMLSGTLAEVWCTALAVIATGDLWGWWNLL
jgi:hypothetical protein